MSILKSAMAFLKKLKFGEDLETFSENPKYFLLNKFYAKMKKITAGGSRSDHFRTN